MNRLRTSYLGLELRSPLVAASSPLTGCIEDLLEIEQAGAGAVVLPSLFEEDVTAEALSDEMVVSAMGESNPEALSYLPSPISVQSQPDEYLAFIEATKQAISIPVIASLNAEAPEAWGHYARLMQDAGADALELNIHRVATDLDTTENEIVGYFRDCVAAAHAAVDIPIAAKIGPYFAALGNVASQLVAAGTRGLTLFNRFYEPDIDLDTLDVVPRLRLSDSRDLGPTLRWVAILNGRVGASLAAATGIHTWEDTLKALLAGADVAMPASALIREGPQHLRSVNESLLEWLSTHEYESIDQLRGSVSRRSVPDPEAYERANYVRSLRAYPDFG